MTVPAQLTQLGFRSVAEFQRAWNLGPRLAADGVFGPATSAAATLSVTRRKNRLGDLSAHFSAAEFACHCGGRLPGCHLTVVLRDLLQSLEVLRAHTGPVRIVSGYRCPAYNRKVVGASESQHMWGGAADIPAAHSHQTITAMHVFAGVGWDASNGLVVHVDRRDVSGHDTTGGTVTAPTTWTYPR